MEKRENRHHLEPGAISVSQCSDCSNYQFYSLLELASNPDLGNCKAFHRTPEQYMLNQKPCPKRVPEGV